jgi:hypothetical protein
MTFDVDAYHFDVLGEERDISQRSLLLLLTEGNL